MESGPFRPVIHNAIITAITIAVALIWKDLIETAIRSIVPGDGLLTSQLITALLATLIAIVLIYAFIQTETETTEFIEEIKKRRRPRQTGQPPLPPPK